MKSNVRMRECLTPIPEDIRKKVITRILKELDKRTKSGYAPGRAGMISSIKLGLLAYEEDNANIRINNFGQYANIYQFIASLPKKNTSIEVAIWFD